MTNEYWTFYITRLPIVALRSFDIPSNHATIRVSSHRVPDMSGKLNSLKRQYWPILRSAPRREYPESHRDTPLPFPIPPLDSDLFLFMSGLLKSPERKTFSASLLLNFPCSQAVFDGPKQIPNANFQRSIANSF